jgi:hypothetical protein
MYDWQAEIEREHKAQKKRWNGKVITTANQWRFNDSGSKTVDCYSEEKIWDAVKDYYNSREW